MASGTKLVIVESPAKAKTIGKFLGRGYKVEACNGHVRDLPKSQIGVDVDNGFEPRYITIRGRGKDLDRIRKEAHSAQQVFLATDPDREGEAISWHLAHVLKIPQDAPCRVTFNEITSAAVKAAIKKPRKIDLGLVDAQQARRVLDRLVGYKLSPLLWAKVRKGLSAGRVQSMATRMIVDREAEIEDFVPEEYWTLEGRMQSGRQKFTARLALLDGEKPEIHSQQEADAVAQRLKAEQFTISSVRRGERRRNPGAPFTTAMLQQEAVKQLNMTTRRTMQIAQMLYEGVDVPKHGTLGLISYIRTDSTRVSAEAQAAARRHISETFAPEYLPEQSPQYAGRSGAQDAHEAIRPTVLEVTPESVKSVLTRDQYRLYRLIYNRFLASQMAPAVYDTMAVTIKGSGAELRFSGAHMRFAGFTAVYEESRDEGAERETSLPDVKEGDEVSMIGLDVEQHFTQPPARYTEASLVRALEEKGIGRPSTYAPIISVILQRDYVKREGKALRPTELGEIVTEMMEEYFQDIVDESFTAELENGLDRVEEGHADWRQLVADFYAPFSQALEVAEKGIEKVELVDEVSDVQCEKCGAMMVYKMGRYGRFLACPNFPQCRNTMTIVHTLPTPCPKCGAKLIERSSKKGRHFYGCERYPDCNFISWEMPVEQKCSQCGSYMVFKRDRKGDSYHVCANEECKHKVLLEDEN